MAACLLARTPTGALRAVASLCGALRGNAHRIPFPHRPPHLCCTPPSCINLAAAPTGCGNMDQRCCLGSTLGRPAGERWGRKGGARAAWVFSAGAGEKNSAPSEAKAAPARQRCDVHARCLQARHCEPPGEEPCRRNPAVAAPPRSALRRRAVRPCASPPPAPAPLPCPLHASPHPSIPSAPCTPQPSTSAPQPQLPLAAPPPRTGAPTCGCLRADPQRFGEEGRTARSTTHSTICSCLRRLRDPMQRRLRRKRRGLNRQGAAAADAHCKTGQCQRRKGRPLPARVVAGKVAL